MDKTNVARLIANNLLNYPEYIELTKDSLNTSSKDTLIHEIESVVNDELNGAGDILTDSIVNEYQIESERQGIINNHLLNGGCYEYHQELIEQIIEYMYKEVK